MSSPTLETAVQPADPTSETPSVPGGANSRPNVGGNVQEEENSAAPSDVSQLRRLVRLLVVFAMIVLAVMLALVVGVILVVTLDSSDDSSSSPSSGRESGLQPPQTTAAPILPPAPSAAPIQISPTLSPLQPTPQPTPIIGPPSAPPIATPSPTSTLPWTPPVQVAKLLASDGVSGDWFGRSVAASGDTLVVGAPYDDSTQGSAYVFVRDGGGAWTQQAKLAASDGSSGDWFGWSVAIDNNVIVVGAWRDNGAAGAIDTGSAYVFQRVGTIWNQQAKLTADNPATDDYFGYSVAVDGDTIVVMAWWDDDAGTDSGSAYVFQRSVTDSTWSQQAKLTANDASSGDQFGRSVAIDRDTIVVGVTRDDDGGTDSGSVYVFQRVGTTWSQQAKLTAAGDAAANDRFGVSVAVENDLIVVGSFWDDHSGGTDSGSVYVFQRVGSIWSQQAKLTASDAAPNDRFGFSVSIDATSTIVVGAFFDDDGGRTDSGSVYIFRRIGGAATWSQQAKLTASDAAVEDWFGVAVAIDNGIIVVGAYGDDDGGSRRGSAYVFE